MDNEDRREVVGESLHVHCSHNERSAKLCMPVELSQMVLGKKTARARRNFPDQRSA